MNGDKEWNLTRADYMYFSAVGQTGSHCGQACTNGGRYCALDPDGDDFYGLTGADIVRETLRQLCVHEVSTAARQPHKWWQYTALASERCGEFRVLPMAEECTHARVRHALLRAIGVDPAAVAACETRSGGTHTDGENTLLAGQLAAAREAGVGAVPLLVING